MLNSPYIKTINQWKGTTEDLCYELFLLLKKDKNKTSNFKFLCENFDFFEEEEAKNVYFSEKEIKELGATFGSYIDETIKSALYSTYLQNKPIEFAYDLLWNLIFDNDLFMTDKEKSFALFWIIIDNMIPFQSLNSAIKMDAEQFKKISDTLKSSIHRIEYLIDFPFVQRTETASLIMEEIQKCKTTDEKAVIMSYALAIHTDKAISKIQNNRKED